MSSQRSSSLSSNRSGSSHNSRVSPEGARSVSDELDEMLDVESGYVTAAADTEELPVYSLDMTRNDNGEVQEVENDLHETSSHLSGGGDSYRDASEHLPDEDEVEAQASSTARSTTNFESLESGLGDPINQQTQKETTLYPTASSTSERVSMQVHDLLEASESSASAGVILDKKEQPKIEATSAKRRPMKDSFTQSAANNTPMTDSSVQSVPSIRRDETIETVGGRRESSLPPDNRSSLKPGSSRYIFQQQYQRRAQPAEISKRISMSQVESGPHGKSGRGKPMNAVPAPLHTSMPHINYHDREEQFAANDDSSSSHFDLDLRVPTAHQSLSQHLMATGSAKLASGDHEKPTEQGRIKTGRVSATSMDTNVNLQEFYPDIKNKIGDLATKPVTAASLAAQAKSDKSASSTLFAPRKIDSVDQSVNLMDPTTRSYESGSTSSGSGSGTRKGINMSAPSRPKKYGAKTSKGINSDQDTFFASSLLSFLETPQTVTQKSNATTAKGQRDLQSSEGKWCNYKITWFIAIVVIAGSFMIVTQTKLWDNVIGISEATKSGSANDRAAIRANLRDGEDNSNPALSKTAHLTRGGDEEETSTIQFSRMKFLRDLLVEHGVSDPDELHWEGFEKDYNQFVHFSSRTKALIWLAHSKNVSRPLEEQSEMVHRELFQRYTLAVLYYETHEDTTHNNSTIRRMDSLLPNMHHSLWVHQDNWLTEDTSVCDWYGVICDKERAEKETVVALNLTKNGLKGSLPLREMNYAFRWNLEQLILSRNAISGTLDDLEEDGKGFAWPHLEYLDLQDNALEGGIPFKWLQSCKKLKEIKLSRNRLNAKLPPSAFGLHENLLTLDLGHNDLHGTIEVLGYLPKLEYLSLENNQFDSEFPKEIFQLTSLVELRACCNGFSGGIPTELAYMSNLEILSLEYNRLELHIPENVFESTTSLVQLALHSNDFDGTLPSTLGCLKQLETLALQNNRFSGLLPSELSELTKLKSLLIFHNDLMGTLPPDICSLKEGAALFPKQLKYIAADCKEDLTCSCCDQCY